MNSNGAVSHLEYIQHARGQLVDGAAGGGWGAPPADGAAGGLSELSELFYAHDADQVRHSPGNASPPCPPAE